jgi:hypothetical protein
VIFSEPLILAKIIVHKPNPYGWCISKWNIIDLLTRPHITHAPPKISRAAPRCLAHHPNFSRAPQIMLKPFCIGNCFRYLQSKTIKCIKWGCVSILGGARVTWGAVRNFPSLMDKLGLCTITWITFSLWLDENFGHNLWSPDTRYDTDIHKGHN